MNKADILFLDIYRSVRGGWAGGIVERSRLMIELLPKTTLDDNIKGWFEEHIGKMAYSYENIPDFDGRTWARDSDYSYIRLMDSNWFDENYYLSNSLYADREGTKYVEFMDYFGSFEWDKPSPESLKETRVKVERFLNE